MREIVAFFLEIWLIFISLDIFAECVFDGFAFI